MRVPRALTLFAPVLLAMYTAVPSAAFGQTSEVSVPERGEGLEIEVFNLGEGGLYQNITVIHGEERAIVVDTPFRLSDAHRIVAEILERGLTVDTIFITHSHPDHYFGATVFLDAFPNARYVSLFSIAEYVAISIPGRVEAWRDVLGVNGPAYPLVPIGIEDDSLELEGHRIDIVGPIVGDHATSAGLYVPSLRTLAVGDVTFHDFHVFMAHHPAEERAAWLATLDDLEAMAPAWVIPGHSAELPERNADSIAFTRDYLIAFEEVVSQTRDPRMIMAEMQRRYPDAKDVLGDLILQSSAIVAAGVIPPIDDSFRQRDFPTGGPDGHSHAPQGSPSAEGQD